MKKKRMNLLQGFIGGLQYNARGRLLYTGETNSSAQNQFDTLETVGWCVVVGYANSNGSMNNAWTERIVTISRQQF